MCYNLIHGKVIASFGLLGDILYCCKWLISGRGSRYVKEVYLLELWHEIIFRLVLGFN